VRIRVLVGICEDLQSQKHPSIVPHSAAVSARTQLTAGIPVHDAADQEHPCSSAQLVSDEFSVQMKLKPVHVFELVFQ
jgi:hypothetical protein